MALSDYIIEAHKELNSVEEGEEREVHSSSQTDSGEGGGMYITDQDEVAELLAKHFAGKSKDKHDRVQFVLSEASVDDQIGYNKQITMVELMKAIQSSTSKELGPDTIPYIFIEKLTTKQMEHLLHFLNYVGSYTQLECQGNGKRLL